DSPIRARSAAASRSASLPTARRRRGRRAADRMLRRRGRPSRLPLERLVAELDLVALASARRPENCLELVRRRRRPRDAESALSPEHAIRATRRLRAVDEKVDELVLATRRRGRGALVRRDKLEQRPLQLLDPRAGRGGDAEHAQDALVLDRERRWLGE